MRACPHSVRTYTVALLAVALTAYNQPSNRAPPCLVSGYPDTPSRVTAEKGPPLLGFLSLANMLSWLSVSYLTPTSPFSLACSILIKSLVHLILTILTQP